MGARLKVYVAPGKSVATARGIIDQFHEQPEITPACLTPGEATDDQLKANAVSIENLLSLGVLVKLDKPPSPGEVNPAAAVADVDMRGQHATAPAGDLSGGKSGKSGKSGPPSGAQPAGS